MKAARVKRFMRVCGLFVFAGSLACGAFGYPKINTDGTVEFSYVAPNAASVSVLTDAGFLPLSPQGDGLWTGLQTLEPDIYRYVYQVDGIAALDPDNLNLVSGYGFPFPQSYFEVPGDGSLAFQFREQVTYGDVRRVHYYSPVLQRMRQMHVYTPYGYDVKQGTGRRAKWQDYPVLYLLGGAGESDSQWSSVGRAGVIIQNLIEEGKVKPMIVVMPNGHIKEPGQVNPAGVDIGDELLQAVIPYVDRHYRTRTGPRSRALAGLSLGGFTTLQFGFPNPDVFAYLGVFSSGLFGGTQGYEATHQALLTDPRTNKRLKVFWFGMGTEDFLFDTGLETRALFDKYGIDYHYYENGDGHDWFAWREFLAEFAPLLFRSD